MLPRQSGNRGFVALISALIAGAVGAAITISVLLLGLGFTKTAIVFQQSNQAKALANACAEEALQKIRDTDYRGAGNLSLNGGTCSFTIASDRTITASGSVGDVVRKVKITIDRIVPSINITSWQEVADF